MRKLRRKTFKNKKKMLSNLSMYVVSKIQRKKLQKNQKASRKMMSYGLGKIRNALSVVTTYQVSKKMPAVIDASNLMEKPMEEDANTLPAKKTSIPM